MNILAAILAGKVYKSTNTAAAIGTQAQMLTLGMNILAAFLAGEVDVLCFDEFQVTDVADALVLETLFTALIKKGVRLVMTSNRPPDELYVGGLNRQHFLPFIQLLKKYLEIHHLALPAACDYRKKHAGHR
jgi:cell division protein ZapE